jgi:mono/diheme cytochrome c family protein
MSVRVSVLLAAALAGFGLAGLPVAAWPATTADAARAAAAQAGRVEHGRYLVQQVGMCADCHGSALHGATLDFLAPGLPVARKAPRIAGLPESATRQAVIFLETGLNAKGKRARPPMPQYRFAPADAIAVVAYLQSLR